MKPRKILVTAALPYANGPIHLGHLVEYIQTDIWVRFQKLRGHRCIFICADDTHGTAIMIRARQEGRSEEALIADVQAQHERDFAGFDIEFDNYGSTNSPSNRKLCGEIWAAMNSAGLVEERKVLGLFNTDHGEALPDRLVKGKCPRCRAPEQYGDNCEKCGATYSAIDLIDPISTINGLKPVEGISQHYFIRLEDLHEFLEQWTQTGSHLQLETANYLKGHFLGEPLRDWDVSRPAPYFGFDIPGTRGRHFWYVWFDAPIGYIASTQDWCHRHGENLDDWWKDDQAEIHHFIGKDITYFHTLFWPGMLKVAGFSLPEKVHIHGFLTVGGEKMSKSRGTFVKAETYLAHLDPAFLRYYYASKLGPRLEDLDLNLDEFVDKVNSDLVGKVVNIASRTARFVEESGLSTNYPSRDAGGFEFAATEGDEIAAAYECCDYGKAMRKIMHLAYMANSFIELEAPWEIAKRIRTDADTVANRRDLQDVCTIALNLFRQLAIYLAPVLPRLAEHSGKLLNNPLTRWEQSKTPLVGTPVSKFVPLLTRIERTKVDAMIEASKELPAMNEPQTIPERPLRVIDLDGGTSTLIEASKEQAPAADAPPAATPAQVDGPEALLAEPLAPEISIDEFAKVDLRVARVISAEDVPEAKKLLKLTLSLGGEERRTVFAGIKAAYAPEKLVGRLVVMVANLAPRQMKFGLSEGMVTACGPGGTEVFLLDIDEGGKPGQRVH